jgi:hypothetical protein
MTNVLLALILSVHLGEEFIRSIKRKIDLNSHWKCEIVRFFSVNFGTTTVDIGAKTAYVWLSLLQRKIFRR